MKNQLNVQGNLANCFYVNPLDLPFSFYFRQCGLDSIISYVAISHQRYFHPANAKSKYSTFNPFSLFRSQRMHTINDRIRSTTYDVYGLYGVAIYNNKSTFTNIALYACMTVYRACMNDIPIHLYECNYEWRVTMEESPFFIFLSLFPTSLPEPMF